MQPTVYQKPEIRDANDNIIQQGAFGKNTALANSTNDGWIDYVANDLEFLYDLAKDEIVPVPSLPASGQMNKTYLLTTTGVSYRWSGTQWVAVSSSEAVGRAESAANLAEQWATKTDGTVDGTEYSAKYYAEQAEASADDAQDVADDMATHLVQIDKNTGGVSKNSKRISNIEKLLQGNLYDYDTDDDSAYTKTVPSGALPYAGVEKLGGKTIVYNQLLQDGNFALGNTTHWKQQGNTSTIAFSNGVATVTLAGTPSAYNPAIMLQTASRPKAVVGHKYLIKFEIMADYVIGRAYISSAAFSPIDVGTDIPANTWTTVASIVTATSADALITYIGTLDRTGAVDGSKLNFRNICAYDLTLMFGAGNEPSTVAEFEAMFPADYYAYNAGTLLSAGVTSVVSKDSNDATLQTLSIPAEVQALEGYGWSAGSVYNYVDFERKVFVQRVGRIVVDGNIAFNNIVALNDGTGYYVYKNSFFPVSAAPNNIVFSNRSLGTSSAWENLTFGEVRLNGTYLIITVPPSCTTVALARAYFNNNPTIVYQELATPIETDISAYLTDNLVEVGAGGTLTFPNSNGADYHIPVPSEVTYMIDLQEAISNG